MKFADLHLHTIFSDSTFTPEELILEALKAGLSAVAIVDHDTVAGIQPTIDIARKNNIEVLPGIEFSAEYAAQEVHILGYLIDYKDKALLSKLDVLKENRIARVYKIIDKLKDIGLSLDPQAVFDIAAGGTPGRLHIARAMVQEGKVKTVFEAFQKYIGDKGPAYFLGFKFSPGQAIKIIQEAGGVPVLAHPYTLHNDDLIIEFINYGLKGIEVYYPEHSQGMVNLYLELAKKNNLLVTGGSDCHGSVKPGIKIGCIKIPYELVEGLKKAKARV